MILLQSLEEYIRGTGPTKRIATARQKGNTSWLAAVGLFGLIALVTQQAISLHGLSTTLGLEQENINAPVVSLHDEHPANSFNPWNNRNFSGIAFPHTYWINMDDATDRRQSMLNMFAKRNQSELQTRMSAVNVEQMQKMLWKNSTTLSSIEFHGSTFYNGSKDVKVHLYSFKDGARATSHLQSIHQAYLDGHEVAIFMEDDGYLRNEFIFNWKRHLSQAPADWNVLQLVFHNNDVVARQNSHLKDPWVNWLPDMSSTEAFLINRRGMQAILSKTLISYDPHTNIRKWKIPELGLVVADEVLYHLGQPTYTSTFPFVSSFASTIQGRTQEMSFRDGITQPKWLATLETSIFVFVTAQISSMSEFHHEWDGVYRDFHALCRIHTRSCQWVIYLAVTTPDLLSMVQKEVQFMAAPEDNDNRTTTVRTRKPKNLKVHVECPSKGKAYKKVDAMSPYISLLKQYDYVLLKDSERRIAGFPWLTFMEEKGQAIISGPLQENLQGSYYRGRSKRLRSSWYKYLHGLDFRTSTSSQDLFMNVMPLEVPMVEYGFTLLEGNFAEMFFNQVQLRQHWRLRDREVETMWCQAARDFFPKQPSCLLVPLVAIQEFHDTSNNLPTVRQVPWKGMSQDYKYNYANLLDRWMKASLEWKNLTDSANVEEVMKRCCDFQHCGGPEFCKNHKFTTS